MVILDWFGGSPSAVLRYGFEPRFFRFSIGLTCGQKLFGYCPDAWCLDFAFDQVPEPEMWIFDNSLPVFIFDGGTLCLVG